MKCKFTKRMPTVATEWQMFVICPGCQWYNNGDCSDKRRIRYDSPCEFELKGSPMPTKLVPLPQVRPE